MIVVCLFFQQLLQNLISFFQLFDELLLHLIVILVKLVLLSDETLQRFGLNIVFHIIFRPFAIIVTIVLIDLTLVVRKRIV